MRCEICKKKAVYKFSPDIDIQGLGACEKHKKDMTIAYMLLFQQGEEEYRAFIKSAGSKGGKSKKK